VIVVDDGSTDDSAAVARGYAAVTLGQQPNRGLSAARNAGLRISRGDIVIFLDADDRLWPDAARVAVDTFDAHPGAVMVFGRCRLVDEAGTPRPTRLVTIGADFYEQTLRDNRIWTPATAAFRRCVFDHVGLFDETNCAAADYDLYLRIGREFPVAFHGVTVADYRQHAANMSNDPVLMLEATLTVLRAQQPYIAGHPTRAAAYRDALINWRVAYGERLVDRFRASFKQRQLRAALRDAGHLLRLYPSGVRHHVLKKLRVTLRLSGRSTERVLG
jgi:glycosyltransferase involved in cell wall biosynthesis